VPAELRLEGGRLEVRDLDQEPTAVAPGPRRTRSGVHPGGEIVARDPSLG
jgi:hypothetical protein